MIISHTGRFVILAPWKAASSTMRLRLGGYCQSPYGVFYHRNPVLGRVAHQHMTYADFAALPESRLGYFTAAFVRNPYDRVYSAFHQIQRDIRHQPHAEFPDPQVRELVMSQLRENRAQLSRAGFAFEAWVQEIVDHQVLDAGRNSSFPLHPAHYWTHSEGGQAVNFIGRVESFEADFARLCATLGLEARSLENANVDASPVRFTGDSRGYRYADRMSSGAQQRINQLFRGDFETLGYQRA